MIPRQSPPVSLVAPACTAYRRLAAAVAAIAVTVLMCSGTTADPYARSNSPYWKVGRLDPALTQACRKLQFNQHNAYSTSIGFSGGRGRGTTGVARKDWNLDDPLGLARDGLTYHFFNDGLSDCTVFVTGTAVGPG